MGLFDYPTEARVAPSPALKSITFLDQVPRETCEKILAIVETRHFRAGDDIIRMRERDDSFYILTAGSVSVVVPDSAGRDLVIAEIPEGSVFGEIAFFDSEPRSATIRARTGGSAVRITRSNFEHLSAWYPAVARQMLFDLGRILAMRLRWTSTKIAK